MSGKARPSLFPKVLYNVKHSNLSLTDKTCIEEVFKRYQAMISTETELLKALKESESE